MPCIYFVKNEMDDRHDDLWEFDMLMGIIRFLIFEPMAATGTRGGFTSCVSVGHKLLPVILAAFVL